MTLMGIVWKSLRDDEDSQRHLTEQGERGKRADDKWLGEFFVGELGASAALSFHHQYIGTEHLLLGLLREQEGLAALALATLGVALDPVRAAVEEKIGRGDHPVEEEIDYVPRARKVLSLALDEAERQGSAYVRTEHILLAMVRDGSGVGADILDTFGVLGKVRAQVFALLG